MLGRPVKPAMTVVAPAAPMRAADARMLILPEKALAPPAGLRKYPMDAFGEQGRQYERARDLFALASGQHHRDARRQGQSDVAGHAERAALGVRPGRKGQDRRDPQGA